MNTNKIYFPIDFVNKSITGTQASFRKAGKGLGAEYEELAAKMAAHPDFALVIKEQKAKSNKKKTTYNGLNFDLMEAYLDIQENATSLKKEYEAVKQMAKKTGAKVYPLTKKWFLGKCENFDVDTAKTMISNYKIAQAEKSASEDQTAAAA